VCTFAFPGLGLLYQAIPNIQTFILASAPVAMAMFIFGVFLVERVTSTDFNKSEYKLGMQIIRRYFVENDPELAPYLYMPVALSVEMEQKLKKQRYPYFHKHIVFAIHSFNSLLAGLVAGCLIWLVFGNVLKLIYIFLISTGFFVVTFLVLIWLYQRRIKHLLA
jgi:hypothetical protein